MNKASAVGFSPLLKKRPKKEYEGRQIKINRGGLQPSQAGFLNEVILK
jgi:hypothetical protein